MRTKRNTYTTRSALALASCILAATACTERSPSGPDDSQIPDPPATITLRIPWASFGSNLRVYGGYGAPDEMNTATIAKSYGGVDSRALFSFAAFPSGTQVRDTATDNLVADTALTYIDAYVVAQFDTIATTIVDTLTLEFGQTAESWDAATASWTHAVNFPTVQRTWSQPGGGATLPIRQALWDRATGDSAQFFLDSAQIRRWREGADSVRSGRLELVSDNHRLKVTEVALRLVATSQRTDSIIVLTVAMTRATFIYNPQATPPADGLRVGGAPAWRSVLDVALPTTLNGPPELCAAAGCPFNLEARNVTYAGLEMMTRRPPDAFVPQDTIIMDGRAVLAPGALPKSPLGTTVVGTAGHRFAPALFGPQQGSLVDFPITGFVQSLLRGPDEAGRLPSNTLAILSLGEPSTFSFAEFFGPGSVSEPVLELVITASPAMDLP